MSPFFLAQIHHLARLALLPILLLSLQVLCLGFASAQSVPPATYIQVTGTQLYLPRTEGFVMDKVSSLYSYTKHHGAGIVVMQMNGAGGDGSGLDTLTKEGFERTEPLLRVKEVRGGITVSGYPARLVRMHALDRNESVAVFVTSKAATYQVSASADSLDRDLLHKLEAMMLHAHIDESQPIDYDALRRFTFAHEGTELSPEPPISHMMTLLRGPARSQSADPAIKPPPGESAHMSAQISFASFTVLPGGDPRLYVQMQLGSFTKYAGRAPDIVALTELPDFGGNQLLYTVRTRLAGVDMEGVMGAIVFDDFAITIHALSDISMPDLGKQVSYVLNSLRHK